MSYPTDILITNVIEMIVHGNNDGISSSYLFELSEKYFEIFYPRFIAPSLPFQGDQAVDAHAARAQAPPLLRARVGGGCLVYRTKCFEGR